MIPWKILNSDIDLENAVQVSHNEDVLIFKHSTTCSISMIAKARLESSWDISDVQPFYVDVKTHRAISLKIAELFSVEHESPQLLLIRKGECIYDASHLDIAVDELKESLLWHA